MLPLTPIHPEEPVLLTDADVDAILTPTMAFEGVRKALRAHADNDFVLPLKVYTRPGGRENERTRGRFIAMPAAMNGDEPIVGLKWVASVPANPDRGLPRASATVILNDPETGFPLAIMGGATISARRTGAVAAHAYQHLGMHGLPIAVFGAGPISKETMLAIAALGPQKVEFHLFDPATARAEALAASLATCPNVVVHIAASAEAALAGCGNAICATTGAKTYITPAMVPEEMRFLLPLSLDDFSEETVLTAQRIVVDDFLQCNREEKIFAKLVEKGRIDRSSIYAQLSEITTGKKPGREGGNERYFVNLMGTGLLDLAVAHEVLKLHRKSAAASVPASL